MKKLIISLLPLSVLLASCSSISLTQQPKQQIVARVSTRDTIGCGLADKASLEKLLKSGWRIKSFQVATFPSFTRYGQTCIKEIYVLEK